MSILGKRQQWFACFLGGLLMAIALSFGSATVNQPSAVAADANALGAATAATVRLRADYEAASSHLEPNFYQ